MIRNRKQYGISIIANIIYLLVLTLILDLFKENYSMLSSSFGGYAAVFCMCILLSFNLYTVTGQYNRKYILLAVLGPIIGALFPYTSGRGDLFSNLPEICAYISFSLVNIVCLLNIYKYRLKNERKGRIMMSIFLGIFVIDAFLFMDSMGAVAYEQFILLSTVLIISYLLFE